jgi:hypothetical protein
MCIVFENCNCKSYDKDWQEEKKIACFYFNQDDIYGICSIYFQDMKKWPNINLNIQQVKKSIVRVSNHLLVDLGHALRFNDLAIKTMIYTSSDH